MNRKFDHELNTCGMLCPEPVMLLHRTMRNADAGQLVRMSATDPATQRDVPKFCHFLGHDLVDQEADKEMFVYWIRKSTQ